MARLRKPRPPDPGAIPPELVTFRPEDWPPGPGEREEVRGTGGHEVMVARFYARRRWQRARREYAAAAGITMAEFRRAAGGGG